MMDKLRLWLHKHAFMHAEDTTYTKTFCLDADLDHIRVRKCWKCVKCKTVWFKNQVES